MAIAKGELGVKEIPGARSHPRILEYFGATRLGGAPEDETPWCSAFANWVLREAGINGTHRANARSWLHWGTPVPLDEPRLGAIAVLWRDSPESPKGHVGFLASTLPGRVVLLGGNQGNRVSYREYGSARLLALRWPQPTAAE